MAKIPNFYSRHYAGKFFLVVLLRLTQEFVPVQMPEAIFSDAIAELMELAELPQGDWKRQWLIWLEDGSQLQDWTNAEGDRLMVQIQEEHYCLSLNEVPLICS